MERLFSGFMIFLGAVAGIVAFAGCAFGIFCTLFSGKDAAVMRTVRSLSDWLIVLFIICLFCVWIGSIGLYGSSLGFHHEFAYGQLSLMLFLSVQLANCFSKRRTWPLGIMAFGSAAIFFGLAAALEFKPYLLEICFGVYWLFMLVEWALQVFKSPKTPDAHAA
jgi:hypothetical protein